ncbi:protein kinase, partial [Planctomycetota bacterium]
AAAHEQGVIHRDLKPANIKITPDGKVKVLDFGLAKAVGGEGADQQSTITVPGRVIGTPAYMSPEQARGNPTDHRSDIWSFGCVLFEMLTGLIPFKGNTVSDTLANILQSSPEWEKLPETTPSNIKVLIRRCMEKDVKKRLYSMVDVVIEIKETIHLPMIAPPVVSAGGIISASTNNRHLLIGITCVVIFAVVASLITWVVKPDQPPLPPQQPTTYIPMQLPPDQMLSEWTHNVVISPDGKSIIYASEAEDGMSTNLILRELQPHKGEIVASLKAKISFYFFSTNGDWIGFISENRLFKLLLEDRNPVDFCEIPRWSFGGDWGQDDATSEDTIFIGSFGEGKGLIEVSATQGDENTVPVLKMNSGELGYLYPQVLPGCQAVLFTIWKTDITDISVAVYDRNTKTKAVLLKGAANARYVPSIKQLVYIRKGKLYASPFDLLRLEVDQKREMYLGVDVAQDLLNGFGSFSISNNGTLIYVSGGYWQTKRRLVKINRFGEIADNNYPSLAPGAYFSPRLSPDGKKLAYSLFEDSSINIGVYDIDSEVPPIPLTSQSYVVAPLWSHDGKSIAYSSISSDSSISPGYLNISLKEVNSIEPARNIINLTADVYPTSWSHDGKILLFNHEGTEKNNDICAQQFDEKGNPVGEPKSLSFSDDNNEGSADFSPNNQWIAYCQNDSEVWVREVNGKRIERIDDGTSPLWSPATDEIFYRSGNKLMYVTYEINEEGDFTFLPPKMIFEHILFPKTFTNRDYDVSEDAQHFFIFLESENRPTYELFYAPNWIEGIRNKINMPDKN